MKQKIKGPVEKDDRPGEALKRARIRATWGENLPITGDYDTTCAAACRNGTFVGKQTNGVTAFLGIPFALPPTGERRWRPPVDAPENTGVYEAYYFGHSPIQTEWPSEEGSYYPQSEDCLTLNVWSAQTDGGYGEGKAVMVFFHGGSYGWGATSDPIYNGYNLVKAHKDVVLVTAEYRVGIMGFIDFSEVEGGEDYRESGNLGLLDHVCALRWVRDNIAAFGGDSENVTIFGESAGGGTVSLLPLVREAKGLFRRVIAESGSVALTYSRDECKGLTRRLCKATGAYTMEELLALDEETIKAVNEGLNDYNNFPERDGVVLPTDPYEMYNRGISKKIDFMAGTNADEVRYWIREMGYYTSPRLGYPTFKLGIPLMFDSNLRKFSAQDKERAEVYLSLCTRRKLWKIVTFYNDILFRVPAMAQLAAHAKHGGRSYAYYWTYPSAHPHLGACHAVELLYVFGNLDATIYTGGNVLPELSEEVQDMWVNFAKTGDPSTEKHKWDPYTVSDRNTAMLGREIRFESDPMKERREQAEPLLKYYLNGCYTNLSFRLPFFYRIVALLAVIVGFVPTMLTLLFRWIVRLCRRRRRRKAQKQA